ncbi:MAG: hypothetical protein SFT81_02560 [Candidatus Caenarcaniphilales bacterium]|nr:hypothetical protein [Candidatus Caenarcaniphilales bacterium]
MYSYPPILHLFRTYEGLFSLKELTDEKRLLWMYGALQLFFLITFHKWVGSHFITKEYMEAGRYTCWPYFQNCEGFYFLSTLPEGYSQGLWYMIFFGFIVLGVYAAYRSWWVAAHFLLLIEWIWKTLVVFFITLHNSGNYDYYHLLLGGIFLFLPHKLAFMRICFVLLYSLASSVKFHEGWILGTYFSSLKTGMPLFPQFLIPVFTNGLILMEMLGSWFLFSKKRWIRYGVIGFFVFFHFYSGILVFYTYPCAVLPALLILFGSKNIDFHIPRLDWHSISGWLLMIAMVLLQIGVNLIPGDVKMTLEGNQMAMYMFEANHQCESISTIFYRDGTLSRRTNQIISARFRCDPYRIWFQLKKQCEKNHAIKNISLQFDHSINGGPFYRIVDEHDICNLSYSPFTHNKWIRMPNEGAPIVGYPVKNIYY